MAALKDRARVPRLRAVGQDLAALENENIGAGRRKPGRERRAAHAGTDDRDVDGFRAGHAARAL